MFNQKLALYFCLVGLAAVLAARAAPADVSVPATEPETATAAVTTDDVSAMGEDGEMLADAEGDDGGEDGEMTEEEYEEYEEEYEEYLEELEEEEAEEEESPEEELGELAEEHYMVKEDCKELAQEIKQAQQTNATVDSELQAAYDECMKELDEIEEDMAELTTEMEAEDAAEE